MKKICTFFVGLAIITLIASIGRLLPISTTLAAIVAGASAVILGFFFFYGKR